MDQTNRIRQYAQSAEEAGLHYISDEAAGYRRKRWGRGFTYLLDDGSHLKDEAERQRIRELAIPPDWTEVWIAADPDAHLQATGRDAAGRKQYIYHPRWQEVRGQVKFDHMLQLAGRLPDIRERLDSDMRSPKVTRERVLAVLVALLDQTLLRIGHEEYLRDHGSHGLSTLYTKHVELTTTSVTFGFVGKSAVEHLVVVRDRRLARQVGRCSETPGERVFTYLEDGQPRQVSAADVNDYLEEITGRSFTTKDFRTWGATRAVTEHLLELGPPVDEKNRTDKLREAIRSTAELLGNTEAVCRDYYLHPAVIEAYQNGRFWPRFEAFEAMRGSKEAPEHGLSEVEEFVVWLAEREGPAGGLD